MTHGYSKNNTSQTLRFNRDSGFTIVELLIVIIVIAILAAIVIVAYNGMTKSAIESSMQSDLRTAATSIQSEHAIAGSFPSDAGSVNNGQGLKESNGTILHYTTNSLSFCIDATNVKTEVTYRITNDGAIEGGVCEANVTTFAGSGTAGWLDDANATTAQFSYPDGIAVDASGTFYVADNGNDRIRKVSSSGAVTTLAGSGVSGWLDATGTAAQFAGPNDVAVDGAGNVYVSDFTNRRIRKISSSGVVTTLAGSGTSGWLDGGGATAQFNGLNGIAVDTAGNVYVAEGTNHRIRKISSSGEVTTLAGSGTNGWHDATGGAARFNAPTDVAVDGAGNIYVADRVNSRIRKVSPSGVVTTLAGSGTPGWLDGIGTAARFNYPDSLAVDAAGNIYVSDTANDRIRKISPSGVVTTIAGSGTDGMLDGPGATAQFRTPSGIAVDAAGNVYVVDTYNQRIRKIQ